MNETSNACPICGEGTLVEHVHERNGDIDGFPYVAQGLLNSLCDRCGEYVTTPEQSRHNKRVIIAARDRAVTERDRVQRLAPADILRIRKRLQLTQVQAARVFGGGPNAFGKYENAEVIPSDGMEKLLRIADQVPAAAAWLLRRAGLPTPAAAELPCTRAKDCPILKVLISEPRARVRPEFWASVTPNWVTVRTQAPEGKEFTYDSSAANDDHGYTKPELAAVG